MAIRLTYCTVGMSRRQPLGCIPSDRPTECKRIHSYCHRRRHTHTHTIRRAQWTNCHRAARTQQTHYSTDPNTHKWTNGWQISLHFLFSKNHSTHDANVVAVLNSDSRPFDIKTEKRSSIDCCACRFEFIFPLFLENDDKRTIFIYCLLTWFSGEFRCVCFSFWYCCCGYCLLSLPADQGNAWNLHSNTIAAVAVRLIRCEMAADNRDNSSGFSSDVEIEMYKCREAVECSGQCLVCRCPGTF